MYRIKLHDGHEITDLKKNGTNFVSKAKVDESLFMNNLKTMTVIDEEGKETEYHNGELIQQVQYADGWYLAFIEKNISEQDRINAQIMLHIAQLKAELKAVKQYEL